MKNFGPCSHSVAGREKFLNRDLKFLYNSLCKRFREIPQDEVKQVLVETIDDLAPSRNRTHIARATRRKLGSMCLKNSVD